MKAYQALVDASKWDDACAMARKLPLQDHVKLVIARSRAYDGALWELEYSCASWRDYNNPYLQRAKRERGARLKASSAPTSGGTSSSSSPSSSGPSFDQQMKAMNDYLYGSGRASSCPFSSYVCN